ENCPGYKNLCELLTQAHLQSEKGQCAVRWDELSQFAQGLVTFLGSASVPDVGFGVAPKQSFETFTTRNRFSASKKVRDGEDALASTRDACAPQNCAVRSKLLIDTSCSENIFVEFHWPFIRVQE